MWAGPLILWSQMGCLNNIPSFRNRGSVQHVNHTSPVITNCGQTKWVIPSPHPIALYALREENKLQKITIPIFRHLFQICAFPDCFFLYCFISLSYLLTFLRLVVIAICCCISVGKLGKSKSYCKLMYRCCLQYVWQSISIELRISRMTIIRALGCHLRSLLYIKGQYWYCINHYHPFCKTTRVILSCH